MATDKDPFDTGADVHFPEQGDKDWREELEDEVDPDDEPLEATPEDVIAILGFDPLELDNDQDEEDD